MHVLGTSVHVADIHVCWRYACVLDTCVCWRRACVLETCMCRGHSSALATCVCVGELCVFVLETCVCWRHTCLSGRGGWMHVSMKVWKSRTMHVFICRCVRACVRACSKLPWVDWRHWWSAAVECPPVLWGSVASGCPQPSVQTWRPSCRSHSDVGKTTTTRLTCHD